jgi:hypothetical protein
MRSTLTSNTLTHAQHFKMSLTNRSTTQSNNSKLSQTPHSPSRAILPRHYHATFNLKYYPPEWKYSTTAVLHKADKPDYSLPKAYRPITLLNTIANILSSIVAEDLVHLSKTHKLLPANHFGGRPRRSTTNSLMLHIREMEKRPCYLRPFP